MNEGEATFLGTGPIWDFRLVIIRLMLDRYDYNLLVISPVWPVHLIWPY